MAELSGWPSGNGVIKRVLFLIALFVFSACQTTNGSSLRSPSSLLQKKAVVFKSGDGSDLSGYLYKPKGPGPFDTILMMHGCAGMLDRDGSIKPRDAAWLKIFAEEGYAVLLADSFSKRGHGSICRIRNRPITPSRDRPHDAYGALQWLQAQLFTRPDRIVLVGWSNGAMSMLWAVRQGAAQRPKNLGHDFRAAIGFYPGCIKLRRENPDYVAAVQVLLQIGLADDWTKPKPCMALVEEAMARGNGAVMTYDAYADAYHAFDHPNSEPRMITTRHSAYRSGYRTVHIGTNFKARAQAIAYVKTYLREVFRN